ncbi:LysR family transcriptional regulator [Robbsia sp. KACC 23696]|uniref:LysR family transcriptional regulator n=1 Tax=Robbsia sp. KACC 23696 TaxID=3149231 RepID=UPI00325A6F68
MAEPSTPQNGAPFHWRQLLAFEAVCEAGGIGQAAERMRRTQPAVSQAILKMEASLGVSLFARGREGSALTRAGDILHRRVRRLFAQIELGLSAVMGREVAPEQATSLCRHLSDAQLRCHLAIAQHGSAAAAAAALGVSQPAVHRAARELERTIGLPLYHRRVHSVQVTAAGATFARHVGRALQELAQARDEIAESVGLGLRATADRHGDGAAGIGAAVSVRIAVGVLPMCPPRLIADATQRVVRQFPSARIVVREDDRTALIEALRYGELDVIVGALRDPDSDAGLLARPLFDDPYVIALRQGHPLLRGGRVTLADLARFDWIAPPDGMPRRAVITALWAQIGEQMARNTPQVARERVGAGEARGTMRIVAETSSLAMMIAMLCEGDAVTLLSRSQVRHPRYGDALAALSLPELPATRVVGLTVREDWLPTAAQSAFLQALDHAAAPYAGPVVLGDSGMGVVESDAMDRHGVAAVGGSPFVAPQPAAAHRFTA